MGEFFGVIVRHIAQASGAFMGSMGVVNQDDVAMVSGAIVSIASLGWAICKARGVKFCQDKSEKP